MYKVADHNPNEILESINLKETAFTNYCMLNYTCVNNIDWTFNCSDGLYHKNDDDSITETKENLYPEIIEYPLTNDEIMISTLATSVVNNMERTDAVETRVDALDGGGI